MNALEVVIIIVAIAAGAFALAVASGVVGRVARTRRGETWLDHLEDVPLDQQPSDDEVGPPIPRRRLRGQPADPWGH